jgi:hypothetical protein
MSNFWQTWMKLWCLAGAFFGLILAGVAFDATNTLSHLFFVFLDGPGGPLLDENTEIGLIVLGAVMIGWILTLWTAMHAANQLTPEAAQPIWYMLVGAMTCWFIIDSSLSVHSGYWRNTLPNILFFVTFLIPVFRSGVLKARTTASQP